MKSEHNFKHDRLQQECGRYLWNKYPQTRKTFFHPANETRPYPGENTNQFKIRLCQNKAIFILPGVWDFIWYWKGVLYLFEFKVDNDSLSDAQKEFADVIVAQGGKWFEIREPAQFCSIVDDILSTF